MITLSRLAQGDPRWARRVVPFLAAHTDPVRDLLLWADVASKLGRLSTIYLAEREGEPVGLGFAFPMWPELSAIGVKGVPPEVEPELLAAMAASGLPGGFVICEPAQLEAYRLHGTIEEAIGEHQMTLAASGWVRRDVPGVRPAGLGELDAFYRRCGAPAWNPVQFETGPYFVAEEDGRVVAAAGTHFAYGELAQVGNVMTDPDHRGRGHGERVTAAVTQALVDRGVPVVSLFVAEENRGAVRLYERLGFSVIRTLSAFRWRALNRSLAQP